MLSLGKFLLLNAVILGIIVASYLTIRRRPRSPSKLDLRKKSFSSVQEPPAQESPAQKPSFDESSSQSSAAKDETMKQLTCSFDFQGDTWEAHEVLGLPAGSPWEMIHEKYLRVGEKNQLIERAYLELKKRHH